MESPIRKLVLAPFGSDTHGADILFFEHGLLFGIEVALETAGCFSFADVHQQLGGPDKRERPLPSLTEDEVRTLAAKASCDAFIDGMLLCNRSDDTGGLGEVAVALRVFRPATGDFYVPDALIFRSFDSANTVDRISLDFDMFVALQYNLCEELFIALGVEMPRRLTTDTLQVTHDWEAYQLFVKGKRAATTAETKLGFYEQAVKKDSSFFLALYNAAMLYKTQTDYMTARMRLMRAAAVTHDTGLLCDVYFELGLCSIYLGDTKTARNFWEKALEFGADNPSLLVNMAGTYEQEEKWDEARRLNELAVERFPDYHKAIVNLGRLHAMFGRLDQAIPLYERALELQPADALRHSVLGGCYLAADRPIDARVHFERAVALEPDGDPGKYAAQELAKLTPPSPKSVPPPPNDDEQGKKKRWGLW